MHFTQLLQTRIPYVVGVYVQLLHMGALYGGASNQHRQAA